MMIREDENTLLKELNSGVNKMAFEQIFHNYYSSLCFFANRIVDDKDVARDLVQEMFITFWEKSTTFDSFVALKSYLYLCVKNRAFNYLQREGNRERIRESIGQKSFSEENTFLYELESDVLSIILSEIDKLPAQCAKVFKMSYIEQADVKTISELLHISHATIMTQRQRAKKILRRSLRHLYPVLLLLFNIE